MANGPKIRTIYTTATASTNNQPSSEQSSPSTTKFIKISESCVKRLNEICIDSQFLRVIVDNGGCSGFQYKFELDTKLNDDDITFGANGHKVVVDSISLDYCDGATLDYHSELIKAGFRITSNPKAEQGCSCGASFALKMD